jgi:hypothetical protein
MVCESIHPALPSWTNLCHGPAKAIEALHTLTGIKSIPWQVPLSEWDAHYSSPLFHLWSCQRINIWSWVRISGNRLLYYGDVVYVLGSAGTIHRPSMHEVRKTGKQKGKWPERVDAILALLELDGMIAQYGQKAIETTSVEKKNFVNFLRDLLQVIGLDCPDLAGFNWANLQIVPGNSVCLFEGQLFYHGLLLLQLLAFNTVTMVTATTSHEITSFAQSHIDLLYIDKLLLQLHW